MIEIIGDHNAPVCEDGVCAVPLPEPRPEDAERQQSDGSADAGPGGRVPVQR